MLTYFKGDEKKGDEFLRIAGILYDDTKASLISGRPIIGKYIRFNDGSRGEIPKEDNGKIVATGCLKIARDLSRNVQKVLKEFGFGAPEKRTGNPEAGKNVCFTYVIFDRETERLLLKKEGFRTANDAKEQAEMDAHVENLKNFKICTYAQPGI